jgi:hypothetical protein
VDEDWVVDRWETPFSDLESLVMVSLLDDGQLTVTVEDARSKPRRRWRITFAHAPVYQNVLEEYRLELWARIAAEAPVGHGCTLRIPDSPWLRELREREPLIDVLDPGLLHWQIATEDDVIDVLSSESPLVEEIEPAAEGEAPAGKSTVYYHPDDQREIESALDDLGKRKTDG